METNKNLIKKIEPFIAAAVLIMLIIMSILLYQDNQLKKEISKNCGWGEEDYSCYCEKTYIDGVKNKLIDGGNIKFNLSNA